MTLLADTGSADLGIQTTVLITKGAKGQVVKTTTVDRGLADSKKKKRSDGLPSIADESDLRDALRQHAAAPTDNLRKHIIGRARQLRALHLIPKEWRSDMTAEHPKISFDLALSEVSADAKLEILAEASFSDPTLPVLAEGVMRVRVPFYVGESVARIGNFAKPLYFPSDALPGIVAEGNRQIAAGNAPSLTVYARHAHAESAERLPIGGVMKLEQKGSVGYAILDIAPTQSGGKDVQTLIAAGLLKSVSLRAADYEDLVGVKINGEDALAARIKRLEGIDFAPDGPAMPTYGVTRLAAEASVEPVIDSEPESESTPSEEEVVDFSTLTLEQIRAERSDLVKAIETPLSEKVSTLEAALTSVKDENKVLAEKVTKTEIAAEVAKVAAMFPDATAAQSIVAEACKDVKSALEVSAIALPLVAEAYKTAGVTAPKVEAEAEQTPAQKLALQLAPGTGKKIEAEADVVDEAESYGGLAVPSR